MSVKKKTEQYINANDPSMGFQERPANADTKSQGTKADNYFFLDKINEGVILVLT